MHLNKNINVSKGVKFRYHRFSKLWHSEVIFKTVVVTLLIVINIILLAYTSIKFGQSKYDDVFTLFGWMFLLLYCGFLIDIESSRSLKICLSIIILINFVCIERNILIIGITIDFLNLGVLWSIFKCGEIDLDSKESYEDEYILPLIDNSKKLLNVYYELWRRNTYGGIKSYNGLIVTRCVMMSCMYLCILLFNTVDKYTNFNKNKLTEMQNIIYLRSTKIMLKSESIDKIFQINGVSGVVVIQIMIITLTVLLKSFLSKSVNLIIALKDVCLSFLKSSEVGDEEVKQILEFNSCETNRKQNLDIEPSKQNIFMNRSKLFNGFIFFFSVFLFGMVTYENHEFDIISRMFLMEQYQTIVLCILLPLFGLLTEISMFRDCCWYFLFSWVVYNFNICLDDSMVRSTINLLSGILFNISAILFVFNQIKDTNYHSKIQEYTLTSYIFHKICYFLGFSISKKVFSIQENNIKNISIFIINIIIISNLCFLLYASLTQDTVSKQDYDNEIEWDVVY
ncbi:uncharacterized protein cubi_00169 [Cryptosporidium ubiquitum]|uniref:Uncharacterized protein n=1 Tax=Cryptosporidium ubiquitum TaxID=857276 RepID=A0A1J4MK68_9CRYT|nr:uncharacterized protein cubi_00169 [Cryptosporidium ubiquitum]OII74616.1 hypothetical protein cubi_00169 [Cryptosporidium ubiquitum]